MNRRTLDSLLALSLVLLFGSCRPLFHHEISGTIVSVEGEAPAGGIRLTNDGHFRRGDTIGSAKEGRADLMLLPGVLAELTGETAIKIVQLHLARDGDENIQPMTAREATIRLERGTLIASVGRAQTESTLAIEMNNGQLMAGPGQTFRIETSGGKTRVLSVRGDPVFHANGDTLPVKIPAGSFAEFSPGMPPQVQSVARTGAQIQAETLAILKVEKRLLRLQEEHGAAVLHP